jgi:hypothetical protein
MRSKNEITYLELVGVGEELMLGPSTIFFQLLIQPDGFPRQ